MVGRFLDIDELKNWYIDFDKIIVHPDYDEGSEYFLKFQSIYFMIHSCKLITECQIEVSGQ